MSSLRKTVFGLVVGPTGWNYTYAEIGHFDKKVDKILATLQTAVLAAAPAERTAILSADDTAIANSYMDGFNMCRALYIVALQQLFESEG